jgi:hypothetical protein
MLCVNPPSVIQHAMRMRHIAICGMPRSTLFLHIISQFSKKEKIPEGKNCLFYFILFADLVQNVSHFKMRRSRYDNKCILIFTYSTLYSCPILKKLSLSRQIFEKYSNLKSHEIPSNESRVVPCGRTDRNDEASSHYS